MSEIERMCANCIFRRTATMECHKHAPKVNYVTGKALWPMIDDDENFCGEFEPFPYNKPE